MLKCAFGCGDQHKVSKHVDSRDVLIVIEEVGEVVDDLVVDKEEQLSLLVNHQKVILVECAKHDRVVLFDLLLQFLYQVFGLEIDFADFSVGFRVLLFGDFPEPELVVASCSEYPWLHDFDEGDWACMSELLFDDFVFLPVPKDQVTVVASEDQNLFIEFLHIEDRIVSLERLNGLLVQQLR